MSPVFATKRRAEEFHDLVEHATETLDPRYTDALDLVTHLRAIEQPEPRAEFTASLREELMVAAESLLLPSRDTQRLTLPPRHSARDRRLAAFVGGIAVVGATSSLAVAAQSALPGEMLYPLKQVLESAGTGAHLSDEARGESMLSRATDRLAEVTALTRTGDLSDGPAIEQTLSSFSDQSLQASELLLGDHAASGDEKAVQELRDFTSASMGTLAQLETLLPAEARDELQHAAEVLAEIDAAAAAACPTCRGGIADIPANLLSAGRVADPVVVDEVVRGPVVAAEEPKAGQGPRSGGTKQSDGGTGSDGGNGDDGGPLPDTPDVGGTTGSGTGQGDDDGPIEKIAEAVTGKGDTNIKGGTDIDPLEDVLEDVDDVVPDLP